MLSISLTIQFLGFLVRREFNYQVFLCTNWPFSIWKELGSLNHIMFKIGQFRSQTGELLCDWATCPFHKLHLYRFAVKVGLLPPTLRPPEPSQATIYFGPHPLPININAWHLALITCHPEPAPGEWAALRQSYMPTFHDRHPYRSNMKVWIAISKILHLSVYSVYALVHHIYQVFVIATAWLFSANVNFHNLRQFGHDV